MSHTIFKAGDRVVATIHDNSVRKSHVIRGVVDRVSPHHGVPAEIVYVDSPQSQFRGQPELAWACNIRHDDAPPSTDAGQLW